MYMLLQFVMKNIICRENFILQQTGYQSSFLDLPLPYCGHDQNLKSDASLILPVHLFIKVCSHFLTAGNSWLLVY